MHIIEQFTAAKKGGPEKNEDVIVVTPDFIGVFDGSTLAADETLEGMTGGRFAAVKLAEAVHKLPPDIDALNAVRFLTASFNAAIKKAAVGTDIDPDKSLAAAGMTLYSRDKKELWSLADCPFAIDGVSFSETLALEPVRTSIRQMLIHMELGRGKTEQELLENDPTPGMISSTVMRGTRMFTNDSDPVFGYGVLNGQPVPEQHIRIVCSPNAREIVIASDGYPEIFMTLKETENYLAKVIAEDPLCYKTNPQPKGVLKGQISYDDKSYIRFKP
jgi:hypothetical protein